MINLIGALLLVLFLPFIGSWLVARHISPRHRREKEWDDGKRE